MTISDRRNRDLRLINHFFGCVIREDAALETPWTAGNIRGRQDAIRPSGRRQNPVPGGWHDTGRLGRKASTTMPRLSGTARRGIWLDDTCKDDSSFTLLVALYEGRAEDWEIKRDGGQYRSPRAVEGRFQARRGYWNPFWDGLLQLDPSFFEAYLEFSSVPWDHGTLAPKIREMLYIAIDAATTHLYEPGPPPAHSQRPEIRRDTSRDHGGL